MVHVPVLLSEVLEYLTPVPCGRYLDGTVGLGGHSHALMTQADNDTRLLGMDRDEQALALARKRLAEFGDRVTLVHGTFSTFSSALDDLGWETVDRALVDIGVSSMQLDEADRGFSFLHPGPLDMRMDRSDGQTAADIVNTAKHGELKHIIHKYGEEPQAGRIASAIVRLREEKPFETTQELATAVEQAYPAKWRRKARNHPATRTFQALRMAVNRELGELEDFLEGIIDRLAPGGRVGVISFHSLEDRMVKWAFRDAAKGCDCPREIPVCVCGKKPRVKILTKKPLVATAEEAAENPRSRSAKLRVVEKLPEEAAA